MPDPIIIRRRRGSRESSFTSPAPSNHVTQFTVTTISDSLIRLSWVSSVGDILPEQFLIVARDTSGSFPTVSNGVPVADDIPLLGKLFQHQVTQKKQEELLIFITPTMMKTLE